MIINKLNTSTIETKLKGNNENNKMRNACEEFESVFISYLLKSMRKTIPNNSEEDGFSRDVYTSMMDEEVAKAVAKGHGIGLADVLFRQFNSKKS
jgi:flagellar protein FlgJ